MSNTFKFGAGLWATKEGSTLAYNDNNGNFKPLPFNFTRATSATRVNKDGLIEVVSNNEPRIDFKDDANGALLLEPARTNLVTYSEDFSQWTGIGINITPNNIVSPNGTLDADKVESTGAFFGKYIQPTISSSVNYTASVFVKNANDNNSITFRLLLGSNDCRYIFNISDLTVTAVSGFTSGFVSSNIEDYGNGWFRCSLTASSNGTSSVFAIYPKILDNSETKSANLWGAQLEAGSYATSYIPTQGSQVTRVQEVCSQTTPSGIIGQTEGTLFFEIKPNATLPTYTQRVITLYENSSNLISFQLGSANDFTFVSVKSGEVPVVISKSIPALNLGFFNKVAVSIESNKFVFYLNGVKVGQDLTSGKSMPVVSNIIFANYNSLEPFLGNVKDVRVYDKALTDAELQALTS